MKDSVTVIETLGADRLDPTNKTNSALFRRKIDKLAEAATGATCQDATTSIISPMVGYIQCILFEKRLEA